MNLRAANVHAGALRIVLVGSLGCLLLAAPREAHAQRSPGAPVDRDREARALAEQGFTAFDAGRYDDAIAAFEAARALAPTPGLLYDLAQAYRLKGPAFCSKAEALYEQYLVEDPTTQRREKVEAQIAKMKACVAEQQPAKPPTPTPSPSQSAPQATVPIAPPASPPRHATSWTTTAGWIAVGIGAAGVVTGAVTGAAGLAKQNDLDGKCPDSTCGSALQSEVDGYDRLKTISTIGFVVGAVGVVGGTVLLVASLTKPAAATSAVRSPIRATRGGLQLCF